MMKILGKTDKRRKRMCMGKKFKLIKIINYYSIVTTTKRT